MLALLVIIFSVLITVLSISASLSVPTFIVFLILKLVGVIAWSWFWVCFPLIVGAGLLLITIILSVIEAIRE